MASRSGLEQIGVAAVVQGYQSFVKQFNDVNKRIEQGGKEADKAGKSFDKMSQSQDKLDKSTRKSSRSIGDIAKNLGSMAKAAAPAAVAVAAVGAAVAAAGLAFRAANYRGIINSFNQITQSAGIASDALLDELRVAAAGTVSDINLMTTANLALAGATGEAATAIGEGLPDLLEIARAQAIATGQSVEYLYNSLITGIKRSSPLLIDNTGLVLSVGDANKAMAESLGISVEQLTEEQKQIALLNATLEAGQRQLDIYGDSQETAAIKMARSKSTIQNTLDTIGLALQPALEGFLDFINSILGGFQRIVQELAPYIQLFAEVVGTVFGAISEFVGSIFGFLSSKIGDLAHLMFAGGANILGAFVDGILQIANKLLFPVIIGITTFIADFLVGLSPPKKGPLSKIDLGGQNVMLAWLEGFSSVSLRPAMEVAGEINGILDSVGISGMNRGQIERRLQTIADATQPFIDQLDIVRSQFDALKEPAEQALEAIDKQTNKALQALIDGEEGAEGMIRALDGQRDAIQGALEAQQAMVDQASLELALQQARLGPEKALLELRLRQLGPLAEQAKLAEEIAEAEKGAGKGKGGAGTSPGRPQVGGLGIDLPDLSGTDASLFDPTAVGALKQEFQDILLDRAGGSVVEFAQNQQALSTQFDRIGSADIGSNIVSALSGIPQAFEDHLVTPVREKIGAALHWLIGDGNDTLRGVLRNLGAKIQLWLDGLGDTIDGWLVEPIREKVDDIVAFFVDTENEDSLAYKIMNFFAGEGDGTLSGILGGVSDIFESQFINPITERATAISDWLFNTDSEGGLAYMFNKFFAGKGIGSLGYILSIGMGFFDQMPSMIASALQSVGLLIWELVAVPVGEAFNWMIDRINDLVQNTIGTFTGLLSDIGFSIDQPGMIPRLNLDPPSFLVNPATPAGGGASNTTIGFAGTAAQSGGMFGPGLLRVGEAGTEYVMSAGRTAVFPNQMVRAVDTLASVMGSFMQTMPMVGGAGGVTNITNNHSNTYNSTFNGAQNAELVNSRLTTLRNMGG